VTAGPPRDWIGIAAAVAAVVVAVAVIAWILTGGAL